MSEEKYHPPIPTVSNPNKLEEKAELKPMDICYSLSHPYIGIGIVLMGPINIPYFTTGSGSQYANKPLDIQNPEEWANTYPAYIVYDLNEQIHKICSTNYLKKMDGNRNEGYIPYDHGTENLRCNLGLIELANKWWSKN